MVWKGPHSTARLGADLDIVWDKVIVIVCQILHMVSSKETCFVSKIQHSYNCLAIPVQVWKKRVRTHALFYHIDYMAHGLLFSGEWGRNRRIDDCPCWLTDLLLEILHINR